MADEIGEPHHAGMKKKEMLIVAGAVASIIAIFVLLKNRASSAGQVVSPSRSAGTGGTDTSLQAAVAAANLQLQQQKLTQDAAFQQAQLALSAKALDTQYAIASKQADAQTARTAIGAGAAAAPAISNDIRALIDAIRGTKKPADNPSSLALLGGVPPDTESTPGSSNWNRLSGFFDGIMGQSNTDVGPAGGLLEPGTPSQVSWLGNDNAGLFDAFTNTLPYDNPGNVSWLQGSEVFYGGDPGAGTNDSGTVDPIAGESAV